jgi:putative FmdB family regulatory protein
MPIYEFKCCKCEAFFELLMVKTNDGEDLSCPECGAIEFERVLSSTNYAMGAGSGSGPAAGSGASCQSRSCSGGSCTTWNLPGHSRQE